MQAGELARRWWWRSLVVLVAVGVTIPLAVLAAHGHALPGLPIEYNPRPGDAYGYYSAVRELLATWRRSVVLLVAALIVAVAAATIIALRRRGRRAWAPLAAAYGLAAVSTLLALRMHSPGAPTIGWPLAGAFLSCRIARSDCP